uniref:uncharacterized protein LOC122591649 n=1 Tax=Erigeron canadensis TaxID=72917 RepID=UPI001CB92160|nr:uncharacterized protein LOC122591649 [Erigeron canadensis]
MGLHSCKDLTSKNSASTPNEVERMRKIPYALAMGSIMYARTRRELARAFGGSLNNVTPAEGYKILDDMAKEFSDRDELVSKRTSSKTVAKLESGEESSLDIEAKLERLGTSNRHPGTLPSNTQQNPKPQQNSQGSGAKYSHPNARNEQVYAITTRAGNTYNSANPLPNVVTPLVQVEADEAVDDEIEMEPEPAVKTPVVPSKNVEKTPVEKPPVKPYQPKIPFPQRLRKAKIKENFKKKKLEEAKTTVLSAEVSAIIKNEIPPKLEDPGSFLVSCAFGAILYKALADLGASINLMSYSVYKRLSLGDLIPTRMSIRLADRSFQYPMGIAENLQIRVGHMIFPVDFVVLEMEADINVPLILGRPIDVVEEEDVLEKELMDFLDMEGDEAFLACSEEEQEMVGEMVQEIMASSVDETPPKDETFEEITVNDRRRVLTSVENPPTDLELKPLPDHLEYAYLESTSFLPVVISSSLLEDENLDL